MSADNATPRLVLASGSPRRRELLAQVGVAFRVAAAGVDESVLPGEDPAAYVRRLALAKAGALVPAAGGLPVLGADTSVVLDGCILGKPADADEAARMLQRLSGREHQVLSAVALAGEGRAEVRLSATRVRFRTLAPSLVARYVATGEPLDKAGAYGIQGLGAVLVAGIDGSWTGVVGLPLAETVELLDLFGVPWFGNP